VITIDGMTPTVRRTKSGKGAIVIITESDQALSERKQKRQEKATCEAQRLQFTPGQKALLQQRKTAHS